MGLSITVEFLRGLYESGSADRREEAEWPPSPARVFCAFTAAAADSSAFDDALRWLEMQPPPSIVAASEKSRVVSLSREGYVPLNQTVGGSAYGRHPGRSAGALQQWRHVSPITPQVTFEWADDAPDSVLAGLIELADATPYLGRSTCPVDVTLSNAVGPSDELAGAVRFAVGGLGQSFVTGVPRPGYLDALREAFDQQRSAHEVPRRRLSYGLDEPEEGVAHSPHEDSLIVLPLARRKIGASHVMVATRALLKALESHLDGGPLVVRGARPGESRPAQQVLLLGLPEVGSTHSSGLIAGLAIARPTEMSDADRRSLSRAIVAVEERGLAAGALGKLAFSDQPASLQSLDPERWTRSSALWVSATPMSADRFVDLRKPSDVIAEVRRACAYAGLPEPEDVDVSQSAMCSGAAVVRANLRRRRASDSPTPSFHARLRFASRVRGPVVLGNLRRYGLGLFLPIDQEQR